MWYRSVKAGPVQHLHWRSKQRHAPTTITSAFGTATHSNDKTTLTASSYRSARRQRELDVVKRAGDWKSLRSLAGDNSKANTATRAWYTNDKNRKRNEPGMKSMTHLDDHPVYGQPMTEQEASEIAARIRKLDWVDLTMNSERSWVTRVDYDVESAPADAALAAETYRQAAVSDFNSTVAKTGGYLKSALRQVSRFGIPGTNYNTSPDFKWAESKLEDGSIFRHKTYNPGGSCLSEMISENPCSFKSVFATDFDDPQTSDYQSMKSQPESVSGRSELKPKSEDIRITSQNVANPRYAAPEDTVSQDRSNTRSRGDDPPSSSQTETISRQASQNANDPDSVITRYTTPYGTYARSLGTQPETAETRYRNPSYAPLPEIQPGWQERNNPDSSFGPTTENSTSGQYSPSTVTAHGLWRNNKKMNDDALQTSMHPESQEYRTSPSQHRLDQNSYLTYSQGTGKQPQSDPYQEQYTSQRQSAASPSYPVHTNGTIPFTSCRKAASDPTGYGRSTVAGPSWVYCKSTILFRCSG